MRVIKFRAWKDGEMSNPFYFGQVASFSSGMVTSYFGDEIMQFTGLTDANGVEIYESDIVEDHNGIDIVKYSERYAGFRVSYGDGTAKWFYDYNLRGERESIVVIGNFHQDQGLLEYDYV